MARARFSISLYLPAAENLDEGEIATLPDNQRKAAFRLRSVAVSMLDLLESRSANKRWNRIRRSAYPASLRSGFVTIIF
jgi:hypothetical protein